MIVRRLFVVMFSVVLAMAFAGCAGRQAVQPTPTPTPGPTPNLRGLSYYEKFRLMSEGEASVESFLSHADSNTDVAMAFTTLMTGQYDMAFQMVAGTASGTITSEYLRENPAASSEADLLIGEIYEHAEVYMLTVESASTGRMYAVGVAGKRVVAYFPLYVVGLPPQIEEMRGEYQKYLFKEEPLPLPGDAEGA